MSSFQFEAENIKTFAQYTPIYFFLAENTENYVEKYLFSDNVRFPAEVHEYHGTGLIYGNKLNYQLGNRSQDPLPE